MTHTLTFSKTGATIDPTTDESRVLSFSPSTPSLSVKEVIDAYKDGGDITDVTRRNVQENIELLLRPTGSNDMSQCEDFVQELELMFIEAERYQRDNGGAQWHINYTPHDTTGTWRSEILAGSVFVPEESMHQWAIGDAAKVMVSLVRRFYWEGGLSELSLSNPNLVIVL